MTYILGQYIDSPPTYTHTNTHIPVSVLHTQNLHMQAPTRPPLNSLRMLIYVTKATKKEDNTANVNIIYNFKTVSFQWYIEYMYLENHHW